jgi:hypothetical protein
LLDRPSPHGKQDRFLSQRPTQNRIDLGAMRRMLTRLLVAGFMGLAGWWRFAGTKKNGSGER